jgi:hypothetical protein
MSLLTMKRKIILGFLLIWASTTLWAQTPAWQQKFEQLGEILPTPNEYRTGAGAPGHLYWQQKADYEIDVTLDEEKKQIKGKETITYHNNSPETLKYLWMQLDQNLREQGSMRDKAATGRLNNEMPAKMFEATTQQMQDYDGGFKILAVTDASGKALPYTINATMMRIDLPTPLKSGEKVSFKVEWYYNEYDRMRIDGRGGYEFFPEDGNIVFTAAQWFPRMCVFDDYEGWQNKQFMGQGEFALTFGDYKVRITVPADHIVAATGELKNAKEVLTKTQIDRWEAAQKSYEKPVFIVTEAEARENEKKRAKASSTWVFEAQNVRDFAFASSRKFIWDAQAVKLPTTTVMAMSLYPKEGNPLWEKESTKAVVATLKTYSERTFDYPYPVAISVHAANQGMEYPMICFNYGRPRKDGKYNQRTLEGMVSVIVHEVGHNYFPMIVNSDERQWSWMDEGLNTFLEHETLRIWYPDFDLTWGTPKGVTNYMKGDKNLQRPIMVNSDNATQFGYNAYGKPSAALVVLRETVMGPELFDRAFKEYAQRWMFKHPKPADFFRTMEDASAVDLDWFWRGWFYGVDHVDVAVDNVKWFRLRNEKAQLEGKTVQAQKGALGSSAKSEDGKFNDFSQGPQEISLVDTNPMFYGEFQNRVDDAAIRAKLVNKNFYEITFQNVGGLVTPLLVEFTFKDGSKQLEKIPAEIWRYNEAEVTKVFSFEKEVVNIVLDPNRETADTDLGNNTFPKKATESKVDQLKKK